MAGKGKRKELDLSTGQSVKHRSAKICACLALLIFVSFLILSVVSIEKVRQRNGGISSVKQGGAESSDLALGGSESNTCTIDSVNDSSASPAALDITFSSGSNFAAKECPIVLSHCGPMNYEKGKNIESWKSTSEYSCTKLATDLLGDLKSLGYSLEKSGFIDLFGQVWGCTVKSSNEEAYIILLAPQKLGANRSHSNMLTVSIIHILVPQGSESWLLDN